MRLKRRGLECVKLYARSCKIGALGGVGEGFSEAAVSHRARVLPASAAYRAQESGLRDGTGVQLLLEGNVCIGAGDGVEIGGDFYIVSYVERWRGHTEAVCAKAQ